MFPVAFTSIPFVTTPAALPDSLDAEILPIDRPPSIRPRYRVSVFDFETPDTTGRIDCSDAIRAAHDAAAALGFRYLWFPPGDYFAPTLTGCGNVIFIGPGRLIGAYRKHIIPEHLPPRPFYSDVVPLTHLRNFLAAVAAATPSNPAVVVGMGDSTTKNGSPIGRADTMTDHIHRRLSETFFENTIRYLNYGIGGLGWEHAAAPAMDTSIKAGWIASHDLSWIGHVIAAQPDLVLLNFGQNNGNAFDFNNVRFVIDALRSASADRVAGGKRPIDLLLLTPFPASNMPGPNNDLVKGRKRLDGLDGVAGYLRSFCRVHNFGLIDVHRVGCLVRDGYDVRERAMVRILTDAREQSIPFVAPVATDDFEIKFTVEGECGRTFWDNGALHLTLSPKFGNELVLERDSGSGRLAVTVYAADGAVARPRLVTTVPATIRGDQINFTIYVKDSRLFIDRKDVLVMDASIERHGGAFTPKLSFGSGAIVEGVTIDWFNASVQTLSMPTITNADMFGIPEQSGRYTSVIEPGGGNGVNHLSSLGHLMVLGAALDATRFA